MTSLSGQYCGDPEVVCRGKEGRVQKQFGQADRQAKTKQQAEIIRMQADRTRSATKGAKSVWCGKRQAG